MARVPTSAWDHTMPYRHNPSSRAASAASTLVLAASLGLISFATQSQTPAPAVRPGVPVTLNFVNADIEAIARAMASMTGRHVVVDPRVTGTLSFSTEKPVTPTTALDQFTAALRLRGYALVESEGIYKVIPEADAKIQTGGVVTDPASGSKGQQIVTQIFKLNHENAANLVPILRPLISPNNTINVNPGNNSLVITDYADNLRRLARIVSSMDVSSATDVEIIPLQHAVASDLAPLVSRLIEGEASGGGQGQASGSSYKTVLMPEPRSNSLILRAANPARLALVKSLVAKLDRPTTDNPSGNIHIIYLKNADAVQLATTLRAAISGEVSAGTSRVSAGTSVATTAVASAGGSTSSGSGSTSSMASGSATGGQIQADPATNSLIISAPEPQYRQLRAIIEQLDMRRAQVYVESLIAEVNADKASEFGIQWQGAIGGKGEELIRLLGTNFGTAGSNIINLSTSDGTVRPAAGLNIGVIKNYDRSYALGLLARFLEQNGQGNILSTPNLLTLDNEEAKIIIGQNVPFVTGQYTNNNANNGSVNPFQTIERKDVGLTLRVKPQISENGTVKLNIFQEVSSVLASSVDSPSGLITNKRSIESNVLVEDGGIVVLGGLLQDEYGGNEEQVPGVSKIPVLGNLFRSEKRNRKKTNLMVFLRPVVIRDAQQSHTLALDRYEMMRSAQSQQQPKPSIVHDINSAPALPPLSAQNKGQSFRALQMDGQISNVPPANKR